ncbi:SDR family oxidoreductase [Alphaproteobacteria bacterium]|jgi:NAD(P)-dependent dehydrogenase (short-subunit alcohol dehydrogenase family)|nr:SDR family oxidoreductase [Alphaproteobacteria bacterium]
MPDNKNVIISGASRGIGAAICKRLIDQGYGVIAVCRSAPDIAGTTHIYCDLSDSDSRKAAFADVAARDDIYGLVNNAGIATPNLLAEFDSEIYKNVMEINALAVAELSAAVAPIMMRRKEGRIINISSELILGFATRTAYSASKAAAASFARTWALELGEYNICCNAIAPGPIETELFNTNNPVGSDIRQQKLAKIPVGRFGRPEDVAGIVNFLMSDEATYITGQTLYVCGGSSLGSVAF